MNWKNGQAPDRGSDRPGAKAEAVPPTENTWATMNGWLKRPRNEKPDRRQSRTRGRSSSVRRICRSIPGTVEKISRGERPFHPGRVFVMFANNHHGDGHVVVWIRRP
jgi:hypothetical protein